MARRNPDSTLVDGGHALLSAIERASRLGLEDIRDILDAESADNVDLDYFLVWSASYARQTMVAAGLDVTIDVPAEAPELKLGAWQAAHLKKIVKEILQNIIKHAGANRVRVQIQVQNETLKVEILDDGRGFDPNLSEKGRGLDNLRKRSAEAGGSIGWKSTPGKGSHFTFELHLAE